jgi:hypothetical protein
MQQVGAHELPFAGQRVHKDFRNCRPIGIVEARPAMQGELVPVDLGRGVEPVRPELDAGVVGLLHQVGERDGFAVDSDGVRREAHVLGVAAVGLGGKLC